MITLINVVFTMTTPSGEPVEGATVQAVLPKAVADASSGIVMGNAPKVGTTDASGVATLALWPNSLGRTQSRYEFTATVNGLRYNLGRKTVPHDSGTTIRFEDL